MEMCPACGKINNMIASATIKVVTDSSGAKKKIKTTSYHLKSCLHDFRESRNNKAKFYDGEYYGDWKNFL
jgi:hypothetical protein